MGIEVQYKEFARLSDSDVLGISITVQSMVFGNFNSHSGSGIYYTRNPVNGENNPVGEYLVSGEGEEVMENNICPLQLDDLKARNHHAIDSLVHIGKVLEKRYKDAQTIEFTIENDSLYILENYASERSAKAAVKIAVDLVEEGMLTEREALLRINSDSLNLYQQARIVSLTEIKSNGDNRIIAKGPRAIINFLM